MKETDFEFIAYPTKTECSACGRKILVSIANAGVSHIVSVSSTCGACLLKGGINKDWKKKRPKEAKEIEDWLKEDTK